MPSAETDKKTTRPTTQCRDTFWDNFSFVLSMRKITESFLIENENEKDLFSDSKPAVESHTHTHTQRKR